MNYKTNKTYIDELSLQEYVNRVGSSLKARIEYRELRDEIYLLKDKLERVEEQRDNAYYSVEVAKAEFERLHQVVEEVKELRKCKKCGRKGHVTESCTAPVDIRGSGRCA